MILQVLSPQIQIEMPHIWLYEVWWWAIKPYLSCFCDLPDASVFFAFPTRNQIWIELSPGKLFVLTCQGSQTSVCDLPQRKGQKTGSMGRRGGPGNLTDHVATKFESLLISSFAVEKASTWFSLIVDFFHFCVLHPFDGNWNIIAIWFFTSQLSPVQKPGAHSGAAARSKKCALHGVVGKLVSGLHGSWNGSVGIFDMISTYFGGQNLAPLRRMLKTLWYFLCQLVHDFAHQQ